MAAPAFWVHVSANAGGPTRRASTAVVDGTRISIIAGRTGGRDLADVAGARLPALVVNRARIAIVARLAWIGRVLATYLRVTGVGSAGIVVIASQQRSAGTTTAPAGIAGGASVAIFARSAVWWRVTRLTIRLHTDFFPVAWVPIVALGRGLAEGGEGEGCRESRRHHGHGQC